MIKTIILRVLIYLAGPLLLSSTALASNLMALETASLPGNRIELKLSFDGPAPLPKSYTIDQPPRIALDFAGTHNQLGVKTKELGLGVARNAAIFEQSGKTRFVINLNNPTPYTTRVEGRTLILVLGETPKTIAAPPALKNAPTTAYASPPNLIPRAVTDIDFKRGEDGAGQVLIRLSNTAIVPKMDERGGKITVKLDQTQLPSPLRARLDVQDFATPVKFVDATSSPSGTSITIEATGHYEYLSFQTEDLLTVSVRPLTQNELEKQKQDRSLYTGDKLSLNFQDIDVRAVLQIIADFTKLTLVASDTVQGNITLRLDNVPWDQALDLVLKTKGLDKRQVGNVLLVAPADEIAKREQQELETQQKLAELAPLRREVIQINYAKATDIAKLFRQAIGGNTATSNNGNNGNLAAGGGLDRDRDERGSIAVDERTNNIIAYQTQERLDELRRIVAQLDIPVRQVMIEARIVEATVGFDKSLGASWGGSTTSGNYSATGGLNGSSNSSTGSSSSSSSTSNSSSSSSTTTSLTTPFIDLGANSATSGITLGFTTNNTILDLQLSAMEKTGNGEIVSQPKVMTADKETAKILKGTQIPYQQNTSSGATSVSFKEAALSLEVTPQITPDNRIIMEVKVNKDEPDYTNVLNGVPPIATNEVNAKVLVNDGETVVIGGVFKNTQSKTVDKVPYLGDLPYIGSLFRRDTVEDSKEELLIFLTPRILNYHSISTRL